ncbi:MAG TPA: PBP1A family penicillin-binding protein [Candidatus Paceibacterota bacterium]|nr:PBP1A family penicillin-binding protein [Candidatus Paceibacterota bacterium]
MRKLHIWKVFFILVSCAFLALGGTLLWATTIELPDLSTFQARKISNSSKIVDRTGTVVLYDIHQSVRRTEIPLTGMGENIQHATIAIEDANFYSHNGIRIQSIIRAVLANLFRGGAYSQGGSTITQQIIKNTLLTPEKTVTRKIKEWVLAIKLERLLPKDRILEIYLNDNPYGGTIYGVEEASRAYFNKASKDLSFAEAAYLAAIPRAPSYYSPFGKHQDKLEERKNFILSRMKSQNFITEEQYKTAKAEKVSFDNNASNGIKAPHFVFYIQEMLEEQYGEDAMASGGYTIITTLDYELQKKAEEIVKKNALQNEKSWNASNAALVATNPQTGEILAMVGSRDYFDKGIDGAYNVATAKRQPGSSFKPFVYAAAFDKGYTPETVLFDVPTEFSTTCDASAADTKEGCYHPGNFDDKFRGPINLRNALAQSINVPSVKTLYLVGLDSALDTARRMGINSLRDAKYYGLSLVLGGGEVSLLDMTTAYSTFAAGGVRHDPVGILQIKDKSGTVIESYTPGDGEQVLSKNTALTITDVLSDNVARAPTFGSNSALHIDGVQVAAKTGTTNDNRDAWVLGYSSNLTVGVWSGNNDNKPMRKGGVALSGPIWNQFMQEALPLFPNTDFEKPERNPNYDSLKPVLRGEWRALDTAIIDSRTGTVATEDTPEEFKETQTAPVVQSILYWVDRKDPLGPKPQNPYSDPEFRLWNPPVQAWWTAHGVQ